MNGILNSASAITIPSLVRVEIRPKILKNILFVVVLLRRFLNGSCRERKIAESH